MGDPNGQPIGFLLMRIGIPLEVAPGENRVAATPRTVTQLIGLGYDVLVESGAGARAALPDAAFRESGAEIGTAAEAWGSDVVLAVNPPTDDQIAALNPGARLIAFLWPRQDAELTERLAARGVTALSMDMVPRVEEEGASVAVVAGEYKNIAGAARGDYVDVRFLDVRLEPGAIWQLQTDPAHTVFAYLYDEDCYLNAGRQPLLARHAYLLGEGDTVAFEGGDKVCRFVLVSGAPLREPVAWGGPIVMNTDAELMQAYSEIEEGRFIKHWTPTPHK